MDRNPRVCLRTVRASHFPRKLSNVPRLGLQPRYNRGCSGTIASRNGGEFLRLLPISVRGRGGGLSRYRRPQRERNDEIWVASSRTGHGSIRRAWWDRAIQPRLLIGAGQMRSSRRRNRLAALQRKLSEHAASWRSAASSRAKQVRLFTLGTLDGNNAATD